MRYNSINYCECVNGLHWGATLFVQGCPLHCKGCFNPETWDFLGGREFDNNALSRICLGLEKPYVKRFSVLGGEPLAPLNISGVLDVVSFVAIHFPDKQIWLWTGYTWEEVQEKVKESEELQELFGYLDYIITGPFIQEQKDLTLKWRGSRNQEIIDLQKTRQEGRKVLYE